MLPQIEFFDFHLYTYPLIVGMAWAFAFQNLREKWQGPKTLFYFFFTSSSFVAWLGAKLLFLYTLDAELSQKLTGHINFWLGGGFVFYGGLLAATAWIYVFLKLSKISFQIIVPLVKSLVFGHALGRVGCFFAGCCFGDHCDLPFAINNTHPVQLYESGLLFIFYFIIRNSKEYWVSLLSKYLIFYGSIRFILENFRGDPIRGFVGEMMSTSQFISIFLIVIGLILFVKGKSSGSFAQNS